MRCRFRAEKMPMVIDHDKTKTVGALILPGIYQRLKNSTETEASPSFSSGYDLAAVVYAHWDFLPKFLSLHYYTTLEGVLAVQRSGQAQGTIICVLGLLFFSQNGMT